MTKRQKFFSAVGRFLKNLFTKNILLKVVALLFAIMLWGYVLSVENPEYTKHVRDVDISIVGEDSLNARNMMLVTREFGTTDVDVLCRINKHNELDASRISCVIDLSSRAISFEEGEDSKIVSFDVQGSVASDYGTIESLSVSSVDLEVAKLSSRNNVQVSAKTTGSLPEGFTVELPSNLSISMRGQKSMLDRVARGEVTVDLESFPIGDPETLADTYDLVLPVQFYDSSNILLDGITSSDGETFTINVRVTIRAYKEVDIVPSIEMLSEGYTWDYVLSRSKVILYGDWSVLNTIDSIQTTTVTATPDMQNTPTAVELILPSGVETASGFSKTITVTISVTEMTATKEFEIPITHKNLGAGLALQSENLKTVKVTLTGPISEVEAFDQTQFTAVIDLYGYIAGTHTLPIRVTVDGRMSDALSFTQSSNAATVEIISIEE